MHSPAVALASDFWWRHRWGLAAVVGVVLAFAAVRAAYPFERTTAMVHSIWFVIGLCYAIGVFAYGFEARLEAAESGFPVRLFLLPVRTSVLVGWPMLQGVVVAVALWMGWEHAVLRPSRVEVPAWWPAVLAAVVACGQALLWCPFGLPWLRLLVGCIMLSFLIRAPAVYAALAPSFGVSEGWARNPQHRDAVLTAFGVLLVPVAFLVARVGVGMARRGDSPDWLRIWQPPGRSAGARPERRPFASAAQAQAWYEWRLRGRGFVVTVAVVVAALAALALSLEHSSNRADFGLVFLFIPPLIATFWGSQMGSPGESIRSSALTTFAATRPLDDSALAAAKLRAATRAAVVAWLMVLGMTAAWFAITDGFEKMKLAWEGSVQKYGSTRATGVLVLWAAALVLGTWRALVANLWVGLSGRTWMVPAHMILVALVGLQLLAEWAFSNSGVARSEWFYEALPWILGGVVVLKFALAGWALRASHRRGQLKYDTAAKLVAGWVAGAVGLFALLAWLVPSSVVPVERLAVGVVLLLPLARLAAAPAALAWNRHR
jgi:hypothetical protein